MAAFNPQYEDIGKAFTQQYYALFDNPQTRPSLQALYHPTDSLMSFEGQQCQGAVKIIERFSGLTFQKIQHLVTAVDCQPMFDGGILINVIGQLKVRPGGFPEPTMIRRILFRKHLFCATHRTACFSVNMTSSDWGSTTPCKVQTTRIKNPGGRNVELFWTEHA